MNNVQNYKSLPIVGQGGLVFLYLCDMKKYVDVIVPLPIAGQYTYSLPEGWDEKVKEGCRVVVPFGRKKYYTAIITKVHETPLKSMRPRM